MKIEDLHKLKPFKALEILGNIFETSRENCDIDTLEKVIVFCDSFQLDKFDSRDKGIFYYFLSNAWHYIQILKYSSNDNALERMEFEQQIKFLRLALTHINSTNDKFNKCQILTNLGNLFSHIGRFSEAQEYFNKALDINDKFGMAIGNKGFGLFYYARVLYDPIHQFIFLQYSRKYLNIALNSNEVYPEAKASFRDIIGQIENSYPITELNDLKQYKDYFKRLTIKERNYREWCIDNILFLNPLNDILKQSVVSHDCLYTPSMVLKSIEKPVYHSLYNQMKQEYVSARFLFYESITQKKPHYSDKSVLLMDTLDYSIYSFATEKMKISYRVCYSIFDKIAYFIKLYLNLDIDNNNVTFRRVWYNKGNKDKGLNSVLLAKSNWALRGLYWLSKDLDEKDFSSPIEPEAKEIAIIRNFLEHKSFKIVDSFNPKWSEKTETFEIDRIYFYEKTLKLLKLTRSAIMYLSFLIFDEENSRKKNYDFTLPVDFIEYKYEYKI